MIVHVGKNKLHHDCCKLFQRHSVSSLISERQKNLVERPTVQWLSEKPQYNLGNFVFK